ncbi:MAG: DUF362 domain-containing protein [Spirochaetes bacterium]|nr:DUF362 domain-containing protein [Spirochaetota bacterium]
MQSAVVSIAKAESADDFESVHRAVSESLKLIGGLETVITSGLSVLIKPNVLFTLDYKTGAVTNPYVVRSICRLAREAGARDITIAESSVIGCRTTDAFDAAGYTRLADEEKVKLLDLKKARTLYMGIPNGVLFRRIEIPEAIMKADVIINVPVMKTHDMLPVTLGLKNMKGVIKDKDKKRFHVWGLEQAIVDINKLVLPQCTVIDGTVAMEGLGPVHGTPVNLGIVISSFDTVAADAVASSVMGVDPENVGYIQLATQQGLGCADLSSIEVCGASIEQVKRPFSLLSLDLERYEREYGIRFHESGACSGCRQTIYTLLNNYMKGNLDRMRDYTIIYGQTVKPPEEIKGKLLSFGTCTRNYKKRGDYIPGCPPMQEHVLEYFGLDPDTWVE